MFRLQGHFGIPGWEELEALQHASHEAYILNQKITSETFRHKFLDYNRAWLVAQLPNILTPRTLHRSRPFLITQLSKVLERINPDVSTDDSDDERQGFPPVSLSSTSATIARLWLAQARRRRLLREVVQPLIQRARRPECELCLSRRNLQVELVIPIEVLGDRFERAFPNMVEFDKVAWKEFFQTHEKFRTICLACISKRTDDEREARLQEGEAEDMKELELQDEVSRFGDVHLSDASRRMLKMWLDEARSRLVKNHPMSKLIKRFNLEVSDDESEDDELQVDWTQKSLQISASSAAIARLWLEKAKLRVESKSNNGRPMNRLTFMKKRMERLRARRK